MALGYVELLTRRKHVLACEAFLYLLALAERATGMVYSFHISQMSALFRN